MTTQKPNTERRGDYAYFLDIATRWMDNDIYGHVNNAVYYSYFDTIINRYLIIEGGLDIAQGGIIGVAVETMCRFSRPFTYPEMVTAGLRVARIGKSSVRYEVGLFGEGDDRARAAGHFVHVFIDRSSNRAVAIPVPIRAALEKLRPV